MVFAIGFACFVFGWIGGGDVKFATAVSLWLGWDHLLEYAVLFSLYGGLLTFVVLALNRLLEPLPILQIGFLGRFAEHRRVPYGIALSIAALQIYPTTIWMTHHPA
jgi:prepilin peptidase CpaA